MKTTAAYVAKIIRAELKATFPGTTFFVSSHTYSGGDSINIRYAKGTKAPAIAAVHAVANKFQAGHFDGSTDSYVYTKTKAPTVRHIFVDTFYPKAVTEAVSAHLSPANSPEEWRAALDAQLLAFGY